MDVESLKISICGVQITIIHRSLQREKRDAWTPEVTQQNIQLRTEIKNTNPQERIKYFDIMLHGINNQIVSLTKICFTLMRVLSVGLYSFSEIHINLIL